MSIRGLAKTFSGLSAGRLALLLLVGAAAALVFGYALIALQSVLVSSVLAALLLAALVVAIPSVFALSRSRKQALDSLQDDLRPRLKVLGVRRRINAVNQERSFDLVVRNEGSEPIENCSVAVCSIRMARFAKPRGDQTVDVSTLYDQEVPLALAMPWQGNDAHAFSLRPREMQRIPVCSRIDGSRNPLLLHFAATVSDPLKQVPDFAFGEIAMLFFGGPSELEERLHLSVRENGALEVSRVN